ncbi:hypothetical protein M422DRAFT_235598 [Sphaerobolus stellatus SS14]|uniref:Cytochrome P450 n=1 Tax=Sphaerobolus stellatus (strain SS14) TaxID=990650 RepID=A0A0C9U2Y4_SPHS4|nr:hypothetical protein M422DRAFT_235598 [Sphaerobolus stellatus SS14]
MPISLSTEVLLFSLGIILCFYLARFRGPKFSYPPGPKQLPIVGNFFDLPKQRDYETYYQWSREYGSDIIYFRTLGKSTIILNSYKAATDLLERRSSIYSDRPPNVMMHDLLKYLGTAAQRYGNTWRKHRKAYRKHFDPSVIIKYRHAQTAATQELLRRMLDSPREYNAHLQYITSNLAMGIAYGMELEANFERYVTISNKVAQIFLKIFRPGAFMVEYIPILKYVPSWIPGAGFKTFAREARELIGQARDIPFNDVKRRLTMGHMKESFVSNSLLDIPNTDETNEDVQVVKDVAGSIFGAGSDTTTAALEWFLLAMVMFPETQKKAQEELDKVIGQGRLPQFEDRSELPYIHALVKEVLRYFVITPLALPHYTTEDNVYEGYYIPAKTTIMGNSWALMHDPEEYPEPFEFNPERFLPNKERKIQRDPFMGGAFGFGRRICAGRHLADASIFIMAASILTVFNIRKSRDENGNEIDVTYATIPVPNFFAYV